LFDEFSSLMRTDYPALSACQLFSEVSSQLQHRKDVAPKSRQALQV
jgi:hypothetical protein